MARARARDCIGCVDHRYNILTGISNGQEFQIHPRYGLNFQRVRAQRAKSSARQISWLDKSRVLIGLL